MRRIQLAGVGYDAGIQGGVIDLRLGIRQAILQQTLRRTVGGTCEGQLVKPGPENRRVGNVAGVRSASIDDSKAAAEDGLVIELVSDAQPRSKPQFIRRRKVAFAGCRIRVPPSKPPAEGFTTPGSNDEKRPSISCHTVSK